MKPAFILSAALAALSIKATAVVRPENETSRCRDFEQSLAKTQQNLIATALKSLAPTFAAMHIHIDESSAHNIQLHHRPEEKDFESLQMEFRVKDENGDVLRIFTSELDSHGEVISNSWRVLLKEDSAGKMCAMEVHLREREVPMWSFQNLNTHQQGLSTPTSNYQINDSHAILTIPVFEI